MKKVLSILLSIILIISICPLGTFEFIASAETVSGSCGENLTWEYDTETATLTVSGTGAMRDYDYDYDYGYITTAPWRSYYQTMKTVVINSGVKEIGRWAFCGCTGLTSISIPDSVTRVGEYAFSGCTGLKKVNYTGDIADWCKISFDNSSSNPLDYAHNLYINDKLVTDLTIPNSVTLIDDYAFYGCSGLTSITIPNSVTSIGDSALSYCSGLTSIEIPDSVTSIGDSALSYCSGLTSIEIPDSVTSIGERAFSGCSGLTSITIPDSVTSIGEAAFSYCTGLESITVDSNNTVYHSAGNCLIKTHSKTLIAGCKNSIIPADGSVTSIGDWAFSGCTGLTSITIPDSVTSISWDAFSGCSGLTSITIPDSVTTIGWSAFSGCKVLTSITIPDSVTSIGNHAFSGCTGLTSVTIGNSVTSIGDSAFYGCKGLTSITIPNSVTSIGSYAFEDCTGLTSITIPDSVTSIGGYAFSGCTIKNIIISEGSKTVTSTMVVCKNTLESITIPDSVTSIGEDAFSYCYRLTCITIPDSVTSIGGSAFSYTAWYNNQPDGLVYAGKVAYKYKGTCPANVIIKDGTLGIAGSAFSGCTGLESITIPDSVTSIGSSAFSRCTGLTSITIPDSVTSIGNSAFSGCTGFTSITIPDSVTEIGGSAFSGCTELTSITIPDSVTEIGDYAFSGCTGLTSITIPDSVTEIGYEAFSGCTIKNIIISEGSKTVTSTMVVCEGTLESITIPDSVTSIGSYAFFGCSGLTSITIPDSVTSIGGSAFSGCSGLESITVDSKNTVYHSAGNCLIETHSKTLIAACKNSVIPADGSVTSIDNYAFYGCTGLTSITIPDSVTKIGYDAFEYCTGLTSITIPDSVTSIGSYAFYECTGLKSVTIGKSVKSISNYAFGACSKLTDVYYTGTEKQRKQMRIDKYGNDYLLNATWHYNYGEKYSITYKLNGGKNSSGNPKTYNYESADITLKNPTRKGYKFGGWYSDSKFKNKVTKIAKGSTGNITLTAKWTANKYTVKFDGNGSTSGSVKSVSATYNKSAVLTANAFKRTGYKFTGWNTKKDGKGTKYADKASVKNLTEKANGTVTLYAQWSKNTYNITYKLAGGKNASGNPKTYTVTSSTVTLKNPTRKGYKFGGWYSDSKFKNKVTKIAKGSTGNKTLYAKWTAITYKITYKLNSGKNSSKNPKSYKITSSAITLKAPTRKGYTFKGWYNGSKKVTTIKKGSTGNITLTANWKKK